MEKSIVFTKGLERAAVILMFFLAPVLSSCGSSADSPASLSSEEEFESYLAEKETIPVEVIQSDPDGQYLYKVPNHLINDCYLDGKRNYCLVLRKLIKDGKTYLQYVKAELVSSDDGYQIVKRLSPGDAFLSSPQKLLPELAHKNKLVTRKRFLNIQRY